MYRKSVLKARYIYDKLFVENLEYTKKIKRDLKGID